MILISVFTKFHNYLHCFPAKKETKNVKKIKKRVGCILIIELNEAEIENMVSQYVIPSKQHPVVEMLSGVLKSIRAKEMNIAIMRAFVVLRKML